MAHSTLHTADALTRCLEYLSPGGCQRSSARDAWSMPQDTVQSSGHPGVVGDTLRFAVYAAAVTWSSPHPWSYADYTGHADADYTSYYNALLPMSDLQLGSLRRSQSLKSQERLHGCFC